MSGLREFLSDALGNAIGYLTIGSLVVGIILILLGIVYSTGEERNPRGAVFSFIIGVGLIGLFVWLKFPNGIFFTTFSK